jgi:quercetin dioxygenase-like cupin family protein
MRRTAAAGLAVAGVAGAGSLVAGCGGSGEAPGITRTVALAHATLGTERAVVYRDALEVGARGRLQDHPAGAIACVQEGRVLLAVNGAAGAALRPGECRLLARGSDAVVENEGSGPAALFVTAGTGQAAHAGHGTNGAAHSMPPTAIINGSAVPGRRTDLVSSTTVLDARRPGGDRVMVMRGVRAAGTRAPIHVHPYGGVTCIAQGQGTLYAQGSAPVTVRAGECVEMKPDTPMANSNRGTTPTVMLDQFVLPGGGDRWRVIEPDAPGQYS